MSLHREDRLSLQAQMLCSNALLVCGPKANANIHRVPDHHTHYTGALYDMCAVADLWALKHIMAWTTSAAQKLEARK